jgi:hypothetical protein
MRKTKPNLVLLIGFLFFVAAFLLNSGCKKDGEDNPPDGDTLSQIAQTYEDAGYGYLGRYDTYFPDEPGSFFITPLDLRKVDGKIYGAWIMQEEFDNSTRVYSGELQDKKFVKSDYIPCGDPSGGYDLFRDLYYEFDGQGNLFTAYRYKAVSGSPPDWAHYFCSSAGLSVDGQSSDYPMEIRENSGQVSAVVVTDQSNQGSTGMLFLQHNGLIWEPALIPGIQTMVQDFDYCVSESGTGFLAYTSAEGVDVEGRMNLAVYQGGTWMDAGSITLPDVRKYDGSSFSPYKVTLVRNSDRPYIILQREYNTLAVLRYNGTAIEPVADPVTYPYNNALQFTVINKPLFCVFQDKLVALGFDNNTGAVTDFKSVYQLNDDAFTLLHQVVFSNIELKGVYSDNEHLWVACELKRFNEEDVFSPVDLLEILNFKF